MRVLDLPFTAVEWVLPSDAAHSPDTPSKWACWSSPTSAARADHRAHATCTDAEVGGLQVGMEIWQIKSHPAY